MTKTNTERMAVMETKISSIEKTNEAQNKVLERIENKLDDVILNKADKSEVTIINSKVNAMIYSGMSGLIVILITAVGYLLKYTVFK
jgi:S-adenosylmethionine/arginine decarboxylase-like enzyme